MSRERRRWIPTPGEARIEGLPSLSLADQFGVNDSRFFVPGYRATRIIRRSRGDGTADVTIEVEPVTPGRRGRTGFRYNSPTKKGGHDAGV